MSDLLAWANGCAGVIDSCTPLRLHAELAALEADYRRGNTRRPRFLYGAPPLTDPRKQLERAADELDHCGTLGRLYASRARELSLEMSICHAAGTAALPGLGDERYARADDFADRADELCDRWLTLSTGPVATVCVRSDDESDPRSLVCRMRAEVGKRRLAARVTTTDRMSALAATGPGVIYVAIGRAMTVHDVERTVHHEVVGHAMPRERAASAPIGLFAHGTARGCDDQEGRALALEDSAGLLDRGRKLELARRHLATRMVRMGADFVDAVAGLRDAGTDLGDALRIAARAYRGGGLARERVYLPAYLHVRSVLAADPSIDDVLSAGQVAIDAADELRGWLAQG